MIEEQATRNLNNFLSSYTLPESTELLNQAYDQVTETISVAKMNGRKEDMLDFLEALEEFFRKEYLLLFCNDTRPVKLSFGYCVLSHLLRRYRRSGI